jgi:hypothetical protein
VAKSKRVVKQIPEGFVRGEQVFKPDAPWHWWRPDLHSEVVERALDQVGVSGAEKEKCRDKIGWVLRREPIELYHADNEWVLTWHPLPDKKQCRDLENLVSALEKVQTALGALSPQWQEALFTSRTDKAEVGKDGITWPPARERLEAFRAATAKAAELAGAYVDHSYMALTNAGPGELEPRADGRKRHAANCAYELLVQFGKTPTLTPDGPFLNLASILYEAFSGVAHESIERQCRWTFDLRRTCAEALATEQKLRLEKGKRR